MDAHLSEESRQAGNRRNGKIREQVQTPVGEVTVSTPRDRDSSFDPQFIKKRETMLAEGMAEKIISMYALGTGTRAIGDWMEENPGSRVSPETISSITDRVLPEIKTWRSRSLDPVYAIVWMDAIHYKVMDEKGFAVTRAIYNVLGIGKDGKKDLLGMYISKSEGSNFWLNVLTDLQNRGVKDILIAYRRLERLSGCHQERLPGNQCTAVRRSSDTQLPKVCRQQESKGVSDRFEAGIFRCKQGGC